MKGKKCSTTDLKFNRIAPKKNQAQRRSENSSSSSDEENGAKNAQYGSPVLKQFMKGEGMGLFDQQPNNKAR